MKSIYDEIYQSLKPRVKNSAWIGGDGEERERVPYWLDGFVPLAYMLEDEDMIRRAKKYIDAILAQHLLHPDGLHRPPVRLHRHHPR